MPGHSDHVRKFLANNFIHDFYHFSVSLFKIIFPSYQHRHLQTFISLVIELSTSEHFEHTQTAHIQYLFDKHGKPSSRATQNSATIDIESLKSVRKVSPSHFGCKQTRSHHNPVTVSLQLICLPVHGEHLKLFSVGSPCGFCSARQCSESQLRGNFA